jgi:sensor domain CHASE-containing protein/nitrogen-specific signal transduction histidine kinase
VETDGIPDSCQAELDWESNMSIRKKNLWAICGLTLCLIVIFSSAVTLVIQKQFDHLEHRTVVESLDRVLATFNDQIEALDTLAHDWANWDDTYAFILNHNPDYITSNIVEDTFSTSAGIDLLLIFDNNDNLVQGVLFNKQKQQLETPDAQLIRAVIDNGRLLHQDNLQTGCRGIFKAAETCFFLAARPILRSNSEGPTRGTLIMGRILDQKRVANLRRITGIPIRFYPLRQQKILAPQVARALQELAASPDGKVVQVASEQVVHGYCLVRDVADRPVLALAIDLPRDIHRQGHKTLAFLLGSLIATAVLFGLTAFFLTDFLVLGRLSTLTRDIERIEQQGGETTRVHEYTEPDELGRLSVSLNRMLEGLESLEQYKIKTEKLEALATFAAGATHELATPLSTIAIVAGEIIRELEQQDRVENELYDDVQLIRGQVNRCKDILYRITADAGEHMGEEMITLTTEELIATTLSRLDSSDRARIEVDNRAEKFRLTIAGRSLRRVLRGLFNNALQASPEDTTVSLNCHMDETFLYLIISDHGTGMDDYTLLHAVDPFFTTRPPGRGMGLGLYLARSLTDRLDGDLRIFSEPGRGTTVTLRLARNKIHA